MAGDTRAPRQAALVFIFITVLLSIGLVWRATRRQPAIGVENLG